MELPTYWDNP